jgi:mono/diheme cytochrome c family protein
MDNRRIAEYFIVAAAIGLGVPVFAVLGSQEGEREAAIAYPREAPPAAPQERDYASEVLYSAGNAEKGGELFQRNCVACHGAHADGKGLGAAGLTPPPRDFLDPKAKWTRSREPMDIYRTLSEGNPGTAMPPFSVSLSVADRWALVHYLGTLPGVKDQFRPMDAVAAAAWKP